MDLQTEGERRTEDAEDVGLRAVGPLMRVQVSGSNPYQADQEVPRSLRKGRRLRCTGLATCADTKGPSVTMRPRVTQ